MAFSQLGITCKINGVSSFSSYCADLYDKQIVPGEWDRNISTLLGPFSLQLGYDSYMTGSIKLKFFVGPDGMSSANLRLNADRNANELIKALKNCVLSFVGDDDAFEYPAILTEHNIIWTGVECWNNVEVTLKACKRLPLETLSSGANDYIALTNWGTIDTNCKVYCTLSGTVFQMTDNYPTTIRGEELTSGEVFTIDGMTGNVLLGSSNAMHKTNLIRFPVVKSGYNEIYFSQTGITLQYYPTFYL